MKRLIIILATVAMLVPSAFCQTAPTIASVKEHCSHVLANAPFDPSVLSVKDRSDLEMCRTGQSLETERKLLASPYLQSHPKEMKLWKQIQAESLPVWYDLQEVYCRFNVGASYIDPLGHLGRCDAEANPFADNSTLPKLFQQSETLRSNVITFEQGLAMELMTNSRKVGQ